MLYLNKKGMQFSTLLKIILLIFVLVILIFLVKNWGEWVSGRTDKEICRLSVVAIAKGKELTAGKEVLVKELKCKTEKVIIDRKTTDEINKQISNLLYDCWWQFGEGKFNIAPERWINPLSDQHCFVCSIFEFSESSRRVYQKGTLELWMEENEIPSKKITYKDYFDGIEDEDYVLIDINVDTHEKYTIVFVAKELDFLEETLEKITGKNLNGIGEIKNIVFFGAVYKIIEWIRDKDKIKVNHEGLLMLLLKREDIENVCDVLA